MYPQHANEIDKQKPSIDDLIASLKQIKAWYGGDILVDEVRHIGHRVVFQSGFTFTMSKEGRGKNRKHILELKCVLPNHPGNKPEVNGSNDEVQTSEHQLTYGG